MDARTEEFLAYVQDGGQVEATDWMPEESSLVVQRVQAAGGVMVGKTNTPEFGAGSHTFNRVFGATRNPWDLTRTCGGEF